MALILIFRYCLAIVVAFIQRNSQTNGFHCLHNYPGTTMLMSFEIMMVLLNSYIPMEV